MLEFDVTDSRKKLQKLRRDGIKISFNAWLVKAICMTVMEHKEAAAFLLNKKKLIVFNDINISLLVEKEMGGDKVPVPLLIEKANHKSAAEICTEIEDAKVQVLSDKNIVLRHRSTPFENLYYLLPGFLRRVVWKLMLSNPRFVFRKMGNVVLTSVGMMGRINGWFIHRSIHPLAFGVGSVIKKPVVVNNQVQVRQILNMTILSDHDVIDGAPMVRFLNDLTHTIEQGMGIPDTN